MQDDDVRGLEQTRPQPTFEEGTGTAIAHHGEILQGVFEDGVGRLHRGLITLPLVSQRSVARFRASDKTEIRPRPTDRRKSARAARLTLDMLGHHDQGGDLFVDSSIAIGHGLGSSTADVIASIHSAANAAGAAMSPAKVSALAVAAEDACDAVAYGAQPVLFAHREGRVIEFFEGEYPPLIVVGVRTDPRPIDTLSLARARYDNEEIELFRVVRGLAARAFRAQDPRMLGRVATLSATISQRRLPKPGFTALLDLCGHFGACGVQVAHSGTVAGILIDASTNASATQASALARAASRAGFERTLVFSLNAQGATADVL
jgi:uncharacterized protein involved in propanediol utilization